MGALKSIPYIMPETLLSDLRTTDGLVRHEAPRIHADHTDHSPGWSKAYAEHTLKGAYDNNPELRALRAALRRGIEIGSRL